MKYQDDLPRGYVNAQYAGQSVGTRLQDGLAPGADGLDQFRDTEHVGTVLQDGAEPGYPVPINEDEEEE
jgi:hypothetical protein